MTGEGAETIVDAVEEDNDEDEEFVDTTENYHGEDQEEKDEENINNKWIKGLLGSFKKREKH